MKLYLECHMGASGNMVMAALYELLPDKVSFHEKMGQLGLPGVVIKYTESTKCGITGTHISVEIDGNEEISDDVHSHHNESDHVHHNDGECHEHHVHAHHGNAHYSHDKRRYGYKDILTLIQGLDLPDKVKEDAVSVYKILGQAEARVHGVSLEDIHFHEVGSLDAVVDVVACSLLMDMLGVTEVKASPVHVGFGMVRCEHGILPVPAPATAEILHGIPMYGGRIEGELCTPTGAALLKHFVSEFCPMPPIVVRKIAYGMGTKDFEAANCIRAFMYEDMQNASRADMPGSESRDIVYDISCNLDDMTPEAIGAAFDILLEGGALDVFTTPIMMKKNRPAVMLSCLSRVETRSTLTELMIKHTTTLGVRVIECHRTIMERTTTTVQTDYGDIRVKHSQGFCTVKLKPEYDDVLAAAKKHGVSFQTVYDAAITNAKAST